MVGTSLLRSRPSCGNTDEKARRSPLLEGLSTTCLAGTRLRLSRRRTNFATAFYRFFTPCLLQRFQVARSRFCKGRW